LKKIIFFWFLLLLMTSQVGLAGNPETFFREWTKIDVTGPLNPVLPDLRFEGFFETRNFETRLDGSFGYRFTPLISLWSGFTWIAPNENQLPQTYRPWQQIVWDLFEKNSKVLFTTRTRVEELKHEGQPEWYLRMRERWRLAFPRLLPHKITPVIYDELFFSLNKPVWVNTQTIEQNRAFIGIDTPRWKNTYVEIGYINQYIFSQPTQRMSHILNVYFMIALP
jgi:hypothetical protein